MIQDSNHNGNQEKVLRHCSGQTAQNYFRVTS